MNFTDIRLWALSKCNNIVRVRFLPQQQLNTCNNCGAARVQMCLDESGESFEVDSDARVRSGPASPWNRESQLTALIWHMYNKSIEFATTHS